MISIDTLRVKENLPRITNCLCLRSFGGCLVTTNGPAV